jgi:hypothetical protein
VGRCCGSAAAGWRFDELHPPELRDAIPVVLPAPSEWLWSPCSATVADSEAIDGGGALNDSAGRALYFARDSPGSRIGGRFDSSDEPASSVGGSYGRCEAYFDAGRSRPNRGSPPRYHRRLRLRDHCAGRLGVLGVPGRGQIRRHRRRCVLDLDLVLQIHVRAAATARQTACRNCAGTARWVASSAERVALTAAAGAELGPSCR